MNALGPKLRIALVALALVAGTLLRVEGAASRLLYGDEHHSVEVALMDAASILTTFDALGSHIPFPLMQRICLDLFGLSVLTLRLPALVAGLGALWLFYPVARRLVGPTAAAVATPLFAVNPMLVFYSHFARPYSWQVLLALVLALALSRVGGGGRERSWGAAAVVVSALLAWVHLTSLAFVGALGVGAFAVAARGGDGGKALRGWALGAAGFLGLAFMLYLPVLGDAIAFFGAKTVVEELQPAGVMGVPTLLGGGRALGFVVLFAGPVAAVLHLRWGGRGPWLFAAIAGPVLGLLALRPYGMAYAWARYLLSALPFLWMGLAWGLVGVLSRFDRGRRWHEFAALGAGAGVALAAYLTGPIGPGAPSAGTLDNTYLLMRHLPAFDVPSPKTPAVYANLAADPEVDRIVELPPLRNRGALMYRNYALQHGLEVLTDWGWGGLEREAAAPYVWLDDLRLAEHSGVDYVVMHLDVRAELFDYVRTVRRKVWPEMQTPGDEEFMLRLLVKTVRPVREVDLRPAIALLNERYGPPVHKEQGLRAWKVR